MGGIPLKKSSRATLKDNSLFESIGYKTKQVFIRSSYYYYCEKPMCMRCTVTQLARESVGLCPLRCSDVREFELSHGKQNYKNNSCTQFAREDVSLWPFYNSYVKKRKLFTTKFSQTILRNHLGFITTSAIKLCFMPCPG